MPKPAYFRGRTLFGVIASSTLLVGCSLPITAAPNDLSQVGAASYEVTRRLPRGDGTSSSPDSATSPVTDTAADRSASPRGAVASRSNEVRSYQRGRSEALPAAEKSARGSSSTTTGSPQQPKVATGPVSQGGLPVAERASTTRPGNPPGGKSSSSPIVTASHTNEPVLLEGSGTRVPAPAPNPGTTSATPTETPKAGPATNLESQRQSINLITALHWTDTQNPNIALARERICEAYAQWDRAQTLWIPSVRAGVNYNKHEGQIQDVGGRVFPTSRNALFTGLGANSVGAGSPAVPGLLASFHLSDAIFQPAIAERVTGSREAAARANTNDLLYQTALAYLDLLRAEQELAIARETEQNATALVELTSAYAKSGQGLEADFERAKVERALRVNEVQRALEQVQVSSARLAQQLSVDASIAWQLEEPVVVPIELVEANVSTQDLVAQALQQRPEIMENKCLIGEAVQRMQRERLAPLIPSLVLGVSYGGFGGGLGDNMSNFRDRFDADAVAYWEIRNLGFGERAVRAEAQSRIHQAQWRDIAALDRVAREVVEAHTQVLSRKKQIATAEDGVKAAAQSFDRNWQRIKNAQGLPIETLQSIQALAQARREYLRAIIDYNAAQFSLHRNIGWPG